MPMHDQDRLLKKHLTDLFQKSFQNHMYCFSHFLSMEEIALAEDLAGAEGWPAGYFDFNGGYAEAERKILRLGSMEELGYEEAYPIEILKISPAAPRYAEDLGHRDFLGALMNKGIQRDTIGDIRIHGKDAYVYALNHIAGFLKEELFRVKHTDMLVETVDSAEIQIPVSFLEIELIIPSERLDSLTSKLSRLSRSKAAELFRQGKVFLNGRPVSDGSRPIREGNVITIRGVGKFIYDGMLRQTKKDNLLVKARQYN